MNWRAVVRWLVSHPTWVLVCAAAIALLSFVSSLRLTPNVTLSALLANGEPSADAMDAVAEHFRTMDELLLVASVAPDEPVTLETARKRLIAFATRLEHHVRTSAARSSLVERITFGIGPDAPERRFVREVVVPNLLLYLDDDAYERALARLTSASMREQIQHNEVMIAAPGAAAGSLARQLLRDPLRLREMITISDFAPTGSHEYFVSADGRSLLLRLRGSAPASDLAFTTTFLNTVKDAAEDANTENLLLQYAGSYAIADASHQAIRGDMIRSIVGSLLLIQLFLFIAYRRTITFLLAIAPVALGIVTGFGVYALLFEHITPVTAVMGAVLAGLGIDYCVHFLSQYEQQRSSGESPSDAAFQSLQHVGPRTAAAAATTLIGFLAISLSHVSALREFSVVGALGLAATLVAAIIAMPALVVATDRRADPYARRDRRQLAIEALSAFILTRRRLCLTLTGAIFIAFAAVLLIRPGSVLALESDLSSMHPHPNPALDLQHRVVRDFASGTEMLMLYTQADSPEALVALTHDVATRLEHEAIRAVGIDGVFSLAALVPDASKVAARQEVLRQLDPDAIVNDFNAALQESLFSVEAYAEYAEFLRALVRPQSVTLEHLEMYPDVADLLLPVATGAARRSSRAIALVRLAHPPSDRAERNNMIQKVRHALEDLPHGAVTLTGMTVIGHDMELAIRRDLAMLLLAAVAAVLAFLFVLFRRPMNVALTLLPTVCGLACLLSVMKLIPGGQDFNMINLIALPLLCGIGVDDGIFIMTIARRHPGATVAELAQLMTSSIHAIIVTSLTTMLAFGSLMFTSTPAIQSLGWMTAVGVGACLIATLGLMIPLLLIRRRKLEVMDRA